MTKANQICAITSLIIASIIAFIEIPWIPKSQLAILIIALAVATGLNSIAILRTNRKTNELSNNFRTPQSDAMCENDNDLPSWHHILTKCGFANLSMAKDEDTHTTMVIGYEKGLKKRILIRSRLQNYPPLKLTKYKKEITIPYSHTSSTNEPLEWNKLFKTDSPVQLDYTVYSWCDKNGHIQDYLIINITVLQFLHKQGHLTQYITEYAANTNAQSSPFIPIYIPDLIKLPDAKGLVAFHSPNHPAMKSH